MPSLFSRSKFHRIGHGEKDSKKSGKHTDAEQTHIDSSCSPSELSGRIWNKAYDDLKGREPKIIDAYEHILSQELIEDKSGRDLNRLENTIEQKDAAKRWSQMERLVQARLKKTEREDKVKHAAGELMQGVLSVKAAVSSGLQAVPQAALAWTGICFTLEVDVLLVCTLRPLLTFEDICQSHNRKQVKPRWNRPCDYSNGVVLRTFKPPPPKEHRWSYIVHRNAS